MLPGWFSHAASFCVGATAAAAAGLFLQSSSAPRGNNKGDESPSGTRVRTRTATPIDTDEDGGEGTNKSLFLEQAARNRGNISVEPMQMLPTLPTRLFQPNENLVIAFDTRTKNPLFTMERLTGQKKSSSSSENDVTITAAASRKNKRFYEETALPPHHRSRNHHYRHSGYDRGHLAPAADFPFNDEEMDDTFVLSNISPQRPRFNRSVWLRLEEFVRSVAEKEGRGRRNNNGSSSSSSSSSATRSSETWVITGPLWLPTTTTATTSAITTTNSSGRDSNSTTTFRYSYVGIGKPPSLVAVPTHFYKVLVVVEQQHHDTTPNDGQSSSGQQSNSEIVLKKFAAFVLPNSNYDGENHSFRLVDFTVRLTDLEAVTGLEFFPALFGAHAEENANANNNGTNEISLRKEVADALTDDVRIHAATKNNSRRRVEGADYAKNDALVVPSISNNGELLSKGRQRKIKQLLRENNNHIALEHLCKKNEMCFKLLNI